MHATVTRDPLSSATVPASRSPETTARQAAERAASATTTASAPRVCAEDADASPADELARAAGALGPWVTKFSVLGETLGAGEGGYDGLRDDRVSRLPQYFPVCRRILEVGCCEGAHTVVLSHGFPFTNIVAVDAREESLARARFLTSLFGCRRVLFQQVDVETADLAPLGRFDVVVCVGVLYHLREPWKFLHRAAAVSDGLWLWTQVCRDEEADCTHGGYRGRIYDEGPLTSPLSAVRERSFFPTLGSLVQMLRDAGFADFKLMNFETTPNGPSLLASCTKQPFRLPGQ